MLSTIVAYLSLFFQVLAAAVAISLFRRTKFNSSWILISAGFMLMVIARIFELFPAVFQGLGGGLSIILHWLDFIISLALLIGVFYIRKIFQFLKRLEEIRRETENKVLSAVIKTEEQEKQRFAKELHDGLGPLLSVVKMLVSGFEVKNSTEVNEKIKQNLKQAVDEAIASVRDISANISPHILNNFGLKEAVNSFIKKLQLADGMDIKFSSNLGDRRLEYNTEVIMYRVVCELINNTLRHAGANSIRISLRIEEEILYLDYSDNGIGFDVERESARYGMGVNNMHYRLKSGNGDIKIESAPGKGMKARAYIKLT